MKGLETKTIVHPDNPDDYLIINATDFDPSVHKEYEGDIDGDDNENSDSDSEKSETGESQGSPDTSPNDNGEGLKTLEEIEQLEWHELLEYAKRFEITDRSRDGLLRKLDEANKIAPSE